MKALSHFTSLANKITIYVPTTQNGNTPFDTTAYVNATSQLLSSLFGGATTTEDEGLWEGEQGLVKEKVHLIYAYTNNLDENIDKVIAYCQNMKAELAQEAISLEVNNRLYFV